VDFTIRIIESSMKKSLSQFLPTDGAQAPAKGKVDPVDVPRGALLSPKISLKSNV
jgi:hypothetical protein